MAGGAVRMIMIMLMQAMIDLCLHLGLLVSRTAVVQIVEFVSTSKQHTCISSCIYMLLCSFGKVFGLNLLTRIAHHDYNRNEILKDLTACLCCGSLDHHSIF